MRWLKTGDFAVVTGNVTDFHPMPEGGHGYESFRVAGVSFRYSGDDLRHGFHHVSTEGGPIRPGLAVRISHHEGSILKLEIPVMGRAAQ